MAKNASALSPAVDAPTLRRVAEPFLRALRDAAGETVGLAVLDEPAAVGMIVDHVQGLHRFSFIYAAGMSFHLHTSAPGKAMMAFLEPPRREALLSRMTLTRFTSRTLADPAALRREWAGIRARGWATDESEEMEGCHCVGAPVFFPAQQVLAAIWVTGPAQRLAKSSFGSLAQEVIQTARQIAMALNQNPVPDEDSLDQRLAEARRRLALELEKPLEIEALAAELGLGYSTLRHEFKRRWGVAPHQYRLTLRLEKACELLRHTPWPIGQIAVAVGYSDANYFSTIFKKKQGLSPEHFRAQSG